MDNGISTNGSTNGTTNGLTGTTSNRDNTDGSATNGSSSSSESFTFPLPRRKPGASIESAGQHSTPEETPEPFDANPSKRTDSSFGTDSYGNWSAPQPEPASAPEPEYRPEPEYSADAEISSSTGVASATPAASIPATPATDFDAMGRTFRRRKAMGEAAVRVAGRLAHAELLEEYSKTSDAVDTDPGADADLLLTLLGDYLAAAGFDRPELHAKLSGQSIVIDLVSLQK